MPKASFAACLFGLFVIAAPVAATVPAQAGMPHDGVWTVSLVTKAGDCSPSLSSRIKVREGRVSENYLLAQIYGAITSRGRVSLQVTGAGDSMTAQGKIAGEQGRGSWMSSSRKCSGTWFAVRV